MPSWQHVNDGIIELKLEIMSNWKIDFANSIVDDIDERLLLLILYGSRKDDSDNDYLAIFDGLISSKNISIGKLDFWAISTETFFSHLRLMDPFVTEPVLTGEVIYNNPELKMKADLILESVSPTTNTIRYLISRSFQAYIDAYKIVTETIEGDYKLNRRYWSTLSYSIGYWCFAYQYQHNHRRVAKLLEIIDAMPSQIKELWMKTISAKKARLASSLDLLSEWAEILLKP